ncbi:CBS-containing domain hemolysin [Metapseudomonas furukawaii]|jgi:Mg2+/Co2+ transporter CorB|uniref:Hemolysins and related proteins containing CBS domains n=1 Tax=Metapseudomonas furukawaii TaxID=1149133 RepID=L8MPA5_METFU|nr:CBS-containing domain hemolysin [Pseudomonas furukawaii]ELS28315.1 CBS-containing domain hemolysin [Pseudomonas furukawaii]OWJ96701.1 ion transporter [Pseudomonas sp. A46]BAU76316.1 hemolysins and related proteins containing CBS domains [Pseudomonas furukawaii]
MHGLLAGLLLGITLSLVAGAAVAWITSRRRHGVEIQPQSRMPVAVTQALQQVTLGAIMIPRSEIQGIDLNASPEQILAQLQDATHTRLPLYRGDINQIEGILHLRRLPRLLAGGTPSVEALLAASRSTYFVPESTPLLTQLVNFQKQQRRLGIVVDEYGDVVGLVSLEDIFQELVGEFGSLEDLAPNPGIQPREGGRYELDGSLHLRELNRVLGWHLPCDGPKTLNGLITEALEQIPDCGVCLKVGPYRLEILQSGENRVQRVLAWRVGLKPGA